VGLPVRVTDVEEVDTLAFRSLRALRTLEAEGVDADAFAAYFATSFTATSMDGASQLEVVPGGSTRTVGWGERGLYCGCVEAARVRELRTQLATIRLGLEAVVPRRYLALFTPAELAERVCGEPTVDVAELRRTATYAGLSPLAPTVQYFWDALEAFSPAQVPLPIPTASHQGVLEACCGTGLSSASTGQTRQHNCFPSALPLTSGP
jgi:hypothetical protein